MKKYLLLLSIISTTAFANENKTTWYDLPKKSVVKLKNIQDIDGFGYELESLLYQIGNPND